MKKTTKQFMVFIESFSGKNTELLESIKAGYKVLHEGSYSGHPTDLINITDEYGLDDVTISINDISKLLEIDPVKLKNRFRRNLFDYNDIKPLSNTSTEDEIEEYKYYINDINGILKGIFTNCELGIDVSDYDADFSHDSYGSGEEFVEIDINKINVKLNDGDIECDGGGYTSSDAIFDDELINLLQIKIGEEMSTMSKCEELIAEEAPGKDYDDRDAEDFPEYADRSGIDNI